MASPDEFEKENCLVQKEPPSEKVTDGIPSTNTTSTKKRPLESYNEVIAPKQQKRVSYTSEIRDGWIHTRVPVKMSPLYDFGLKRSRNGKSTKRTQSAPKDLFKDERFPCPDCAKWYGGDKNHVQRSCRHRTRYETPEELAAWDIGFPEDY